ncbi:MAG: 2-hydroxyacyl-CoA dehydratase family protein [Sedimentibacter sp.]|uniref:2-hydroxyacyl-CoA dehydratase subunit D n=1 Tax=Sedimentibacter sp. TaxID=1960295 RepID=UPI0031583486
MADLSVLISQLEETALNPGKSVAQSLNRTGKDAIGCFPIYTPEEIVYAAGFLPVGMWGGKTEIKQADKYLQSFCCSIMRSNIELGMRGVYDSLKAVVLPTLCDTLKCVCENWKVAVPQVPIIPIVYPQNRLLDSGFKYLLAEFNRVKGELEKIKGEAITEKSLEEAFNIYENYRGAMRQFVDVAKDYPKTINARTRHLIIKAGYFMDKPFYTDIINKITAELKKIPKEDDCKYVKVVATGLVGEPVELLEVFYENNISIAADDFAQESRQFRTPARKEGSALEKMAYRIVDQRGCTFLYEENKSKGQMLINMVEETKSQAVLVCMMKFCDPEEFDYPIIKEELEKAGIPILYIETDMQLDSFEQIRTRVQSFAEMLS